MQDGSRREGRLGPSLPESVSPLRGGTAGPESDDSLPLSLTTAGGGRLLPEVPQPAPPSRGHSCCQSLQWEVGLDSTLLRPQRSPLLSALWAQMDVSLMRHLILCEKEVQGSHFPLLALFPHVLDLICFTSWRQKCSHVSVFYRLIAGVLISLN